MASNLSDLPPELHLLIGDSLSFEDRLKYSSLNSTLRNLYNPVLFSYLRFSNREQDREIVQHMIQKHGQYIQHLFFQCYLYANRLEDEVYQNDEEDVNPPPENDLPDWTKNLLSSKTLPQPHSLTIDFKHNEFDSNKIAGDERRAYIGDWGGGEDLATGAYDEALGSIYIAEGIEDAEEAAKQEERYAWRRIFSDVWTVLSESTSLVNLEVVNLVPREASAWRSDAWHSFLARVKKLSVNIWGGDNGAGWHTNTNEGYMDFLRHLDEFYFDHLSSVERLEIVANAGSPYGCDGERCGRAAAMALAAPQMPKLRTLELENCIVDPNLRIFLKAHAQTLDQLVFTQCYAYTDEEGMKPAESCTWSEIFAELHKEQPKLRNLQITGPRIPLVESECYPKDKDLDEDGNYKQRDDEPDTIRSIREAVRRGERRLFSYIHLDDKYGMVFDDVETNVTKFEERADQCEYNDLIEMVSRNAETGQRDEVSNVGAERYWRRLRYVGKKNSYDVVKSSVAQAFSLEPAVSQ